MPFSRCFLTAEVLRCLRDSNPDQTVTEDRVRSAIRRGAIQTPRTLSGCYFWTWDEVRHLAHALDLKLPESAPLQDAPAGGRDEQRARRP